MAGTEAINTVMKFVNYLESVVENTWNYILFALGNLCVAWYPLAILTLIPTWVKIPRELAVAYLTAYCIIAGWMCAVKPEKKGDKPLDDAGKTTNMTSRFMHSIKIDKIEELKK